jgi:hypothetical protein
MLEPSGRDSEDREPLEDVPHGRAYSAGWQRFRRDVEWFVNGERVTPERDGRFFWQLAAGEWNVRAVSRGKLAEQKITVETMSN